MAGSQREATRAEALVAKCLTPGCEEKDIAHEFESLVELETWRETDELERVVSSGDDCGTEWAYVITPEALIVFERRFGRPGDDYGHGVGMFGMGASDTGVGGYWEWVGQYEWADPEPDWEAIERAAVSS